MRPGFPHMKGPCEATRSAGACPFRLDAQPGEFTAGRFEQLAATVGGPITMRDPDAPIDASVFACHHTPDGRERACAGAMRVAGSQHVRLRLMVALGHLAPEALVRQSDEPELFADYDEMATQQADGVYRVDVANMWRGRAGFGPYGPILANGTTGQGCEMQTGSAAIRGAR